MNLHHRSGKIYKSDEEVPQKFNFQEMNNIKRPQDQKAEGFTPIAYQIMQNEMLKSRILKVACGAYHSLFLTSDHQIMTSGCFLNGRLGLGQSLIQNVSQPTLISKLAGKTIIDVIFNALIES